jgi:hypothetical protein
MSVGAPIKAMVLGVFEDIRDSFWIGAAARLTPAGDKYLWRILDARRIA